jgi:hypothetical protein
VAANRGGGRAVARDLVRAFGSEALHGFGVGESSARGSEGGLVEAKFRGSHRVDLAHVILTRKASSRARPEG